MLVYQTSQKFSQLSHPLLRILHLSNTMVCVFPEVEEFLIVLNGFGFVTHIEVLQISLQIHLLKQYLKPWIRTEPVKGWGYFDKSHPKIVLLISLF